MIPLILTGVCVLGLPMFLMILFRSNAAIMFLSACAGIVLLDSLDATVVATAAAVVPGEGEAYIRLAVVLLSVAFAALMFRGTIHKLSGYFLHGILVTLTAVLLWAALPSLSGVSWLLESATQPIWEYVDDFRAIVVALGLALSLVVALRTKHPEAHGKGRH